MTFTVYYKKPRGIFWHKIKRVKGDSIYTDRQNNPQSVRTVICEDETRYEIPMTYLIKFSKERWLIVKKEMEREASQEIQTS